VCTVLRVTEIRAGLEVMTWELHWTSEMGQYRTTVSDGFKEMSYENGICPMDTAIGVGVAGESYSIHQNLLKAHVDHVRKVRRCERWVAKVAAGGS